MKVEEPMFVYRTTPTASSLRGKIIDRVEHETDTRVLQRLYVLIEQLEGEKNAVHRKITVSPRIKALCRQQKRTSTTKTILLPQLKINTSDYGNKGFS